MSYPILYGSTEKNFTDNGLGILSDAISCKVTEERNGQFELQMQYPIDGIHYSDIAEDCIVLAKPNPIDEEQPFRIYRATTPLNGRVTFFARHISYDLNGIPVDVFTAHTATEALNAIKMNATLDCPFEFWTDVTTSGTMQLKTPNTARSLLGGVEGSVLDVYGGEYKFDRYRVSLYKQRGADRGVSIRYGKNLIDLEQEKNVADVYTGVYPYWAGEDSPLVTLPEKIVKASGAFNRERAMMLDLSSEYVEQPTETQIRQRAQTYITSNNITAPSVSLTISHVMLEQTEEYKGKALLERVELCDTVSILFEKLGVSATAKAISMTFNVLLDRIESITFGDARKSLIDGLNEQRTSIEKQIQQSASDTRTLLQKSIDEATESITGNRGGYIVLHSTTGQRQPDELLVMDKPTIEEAVRIWRWNMGGLGYSSHGYNGPYGTAITQNGQIVADYVNTGSLTANVITAGILKSKDEKTFYLDIVNGILKMNATEFTIVGKTVDSIAEGKADAALTTAKSYADTVSSNAVNNQTQKFIFDKLTDGGKLQGLYMQEGNLYVNASYIQAGTLAAARVDLSAYSTTADTNSKISSEIKSLKDGLKLSVSNGASSSTLTLTSGGASLSSASITFTGLVNFVNKSDIYSSGKTTIDGGKITAGSITANKLSVSSLEAIVAKIGGFTIGTSSIYNGLSSLSGSADGVYLGTDGISLGGGKFKVTKAGALTATSVTISGNSSFNGTVTTAKGTIGGWNVTGNSLYVGTDALDSLTAGSYIGKSGIRFTTVSSGSSITDVRIMNNALRVYGNDGGATAYTSTYVYGTGLSVGNATSGLAYGSIGLKKYHGVPDPTYSGIQPDRDMNVFRIGVDSGSKQFQISFTGDPLYPNRPDVAYMIFNQNQTYAHVFYGTLYINNKLVSTKIINGYNVLTLAS